MKRTRRSGNEPHRHLLGAFARGTRLVAAVALTTVLTGCAAPAGGGAQHEATLVNFVEHQGSSGAYRTRFVVTSAFMRIDSGPGSHDFILLNRKQRKIYRIDSSDRTIMIIGSDRVKVTPPFPLALGEKDLGPMKGSPTVGGRRPIHYQFSARGKLCYDVVAVPGLLDDVLAAMREFRQILADDSTETFNMIPAGVQNACDMARSTFAPTRHLAHGFPIEERRLDGHSRSLVNFDRHFKPKPGLFELPKGYQTFTIEQFRKGEIRSGK